MLAVINIFDVISTKILIENHGFYELNPVSDMLIQNIGYAGLLILKISIVISIGFMIMLHMKRGKSIWLVFLILLGANLLYFSVMWMANARYLLVLMI